MTLTQLFAAPGNSLMPSRIITMSPSVEVGNLAPGVLGPEIVHHPIGGPLGGRRPVRYRG